MLRAAAEPADQLVAQLLRLDDVVDDQLAGQPDDVDVLVVLARAWLRRTPPRSSSSSIAAILLAYTALTAASAPITAIFAVGRASVASGSNPGPAIA